MAPIAPSDEKQNLILNKPKDENEDENVNENENEYE